MALTESQRRCREIILSEDYTDFIVAYGGNVDSTVNYIILSPSLCCLCNPMLLCETLFW